MRATAIAISHIEEPMISHQVYLWSPTYSVGRGGGIVNCHLSTVLYHSHVQFKQYRGYRMIKYK